MHMVLFVLVDAQEDGVDVNAQDDNYSTAKHQTIRPCYTITKGAGMPYVTTGPIHALHQHVSIYPT
jgi:hypothetical protein